MTEAQAFLFVVEVVAVLACAFSGFAEAQRKDWISWASTSSRS